MKGHYMQYEQCQRCRLEHCCSSLGSFLWENGNTPNNCKEFTPKMKSELGFRLSVDTTLRELNELLTTLNIDDMYDIGGEGCIEFFLDGEVIMHEIEYDDMPEILRILNERGYWPEFINICAQEQDTPSKEACLSKLAELDGAYIPLWDWIYDWAMKPEEGIE